MIICLPSCVSHPFLHSNLGAGASVFRLESKEVAQSEDSGQDSFPSDIAEGPEILLQRRTWKSSRNRQQHRSQDRSQSLPAESKAKDVKNGGLSHPDILGAPSPATDLAGVIHQDMVCGPSHHFKTAAPKRPIIGNSGADSVASGVAARDSSLPTSNGAGVEGNEEVKKVKKVGELDIIHQDMLQGPHRQD